MSFNAVLSDGFQLEFSHRAMACDFQVQIGPQAPREAGDAALQVFQSIDDLEAKWSVYREDSELSKANKVASKQTIEVSRPTAELIDLALSMHRRTSGAFDMTSASLSQCWGFSRRQGRMPSPEEIAQALLQVGSQHLEWDPSRRLLRYARPALQCNPGGIGKGLALDHAARLLDARCVPNYLVHGGQSSALVRGYQDASTPGWKVAVRHPIHTEWLLGELLLQDQALGTSGSAKQYFYFQGKRYGHIIDPRTGWPAQHWLSVTVLAKSAAEADAIATGAFVMSPDELDDFSRRYPDYGVIAIRHGAREGSVDIVVHNVSDQTWRQRLRD